MEQKLVHLCIDQKFMRPILESEEIIALLKIGWTIVSFDSCTTSVYSGLGFTTTSVIVTVLLEKER